MHNRSWKQTNPKIYNEKNKTKKSKRDTKNKDEMKTAYKDEKELKRND